MKNAVYRYGLSCYVDRPLVFIFVLEYVLDIYFPDQSKIFNGNKSK